MATVRLPYIVRSFVVRARSIPDFQKEQCRMYCRQSGHDCVFRLSKESHIFVNTIQPRILHAAALKGVLHEAEERLVLISAMLIGKHQCKCKRERNNVGCPSHAQGCRLTLTQQQHKFFWQRCDAR